MSLRDLPAGPVFPRPAAFQADAPSDALARWAAMPVAADETTGDNTITIFDVIGEGGIVKALVAAHATAAAYRFGYVGNRRYLKLRAAFSGTHATGTPIAALVIKGHGRVSPQADQA